MPFKMVGDNYANSSMEKLIALFRKLSDNTTLVIQLQMFKEERNFLTHQRHHPLPCGGLNYGAMDEFQCRLAAIAPEAQRLRITIHEEPNRFREHLVRG